MDFSHYSNFYTLPFCSLGHAISKTVSRSSLALLLQVLVKFYLYNREFNGKLTKKIKISKTALFNGVLANLRPLYNSNMAKVFIV